MALNRLDGVVDGLPEITEESLPDDSHILEQLTSTIEEPEQIYRPNGGFDGIGNMDLDDLIPMCIRYSSSVKDDYMRSVYETFCYYINLRRDEVLRRYNAYRTSLVEKERRLKKVTDPNALKELQSEIQDIKFLSQNIEIYWERTAKEA